MTELLDKRLVVVTGKGGVGKSTVSIALGLAAAAQGKRTIVCEVASQEKASRIFNRAEVGFHEVEMAPNLWSISIDPDESIREYVLLQLKVKAMRDLLFRSKIFNYLAAATPGLKELVTIGKIWELAQLDRKVKKGRKYDIVIVDAPATGHGVGFLQTPRTFAGIARVGPIHSQAKELDAFITDHEKTGVAIVSLPEEMPVNESASLEEQLTQRGRRLRRPRVHERPLPGAVQEGRGEGAREGARRRRGQRRARDPRRALRTPAGRSQRDQLQRLKRRVSAPVKTLPFIFKPELEVARPRAAGAQGGRLMASVGEILEGKGICICAGSGGVGKTTTSAAIAAGLAARGQKVAVLTIDPAKRLADSLGLDELDNEPSQVDPDAVQGRRDRDAGRALGDDARRQGDLRRAGPKARARRGDPRPDPREPDLQADLQRARRLAGVHGDGEAVRDPRRPGRFDVLVLDTPPSRNALDFLDAPKRLTQFIEGRSMQVFMKPTGFATKIAGRGTAMMFSVLKQVVGIDLLADLSEFFQAFSGMVDGFQERAKRVNELLADPATSFLIVCGPQGEPIEEAVYFHRKLVEAKLPVGGVVVNKVHYESDEVTDGDVRRRALRPARRRRPRRPRRRQLRRLQRAGRARRGEHRAPCPRAEAEAGHPHPLPRRGRPRPRGPAADRPLPVRLERRARKAGAGA